MPRSLRIALAIGLTELIGLLVFTVGIALSAGSSSGWRADVSAGTVAVAEVVTYVLFAVGLGLVLNFLRQGRPGARAPFVLTQLLLITVANLWRTGDMPWPVIGWVTIALAVVATVAVFTPESRALFDNR